jgi:hypothetical protein
MLSLDRQQMRERERERKRERKVWGWWMWTLVRTDVLVMVRCVVRRDTPP